MWVTDGDPGLRAPHADHQLVDDEQLARVALLGEPRVELGLRVIGTDRRRADQHRRAVGLVGLEARRGGPGGGQRCLHLLALDDHRAEVAAHAPAFEPRPAPPCGGEGVDLAEVRGRFDRCPGQSDGRGRVGVVDAGMAADILVLEHLRRRPQRPDERDLGGEVGVAHEPGLLSGFLAVVDLGDRAGDELGRRRDEVEQRAVELRGSPRRLRGKNRVMSPTRSRSSRPSSRSERAGGDGVDVDAEAGPLDGERLGHPVDRGLGDRVERGARCPRSGGRPSTRC